MSTRPTSPPRTVPSAAAAAAPESSSLSVFSNFSVAPFTPGVGPIASILGSTSVSSAARATSDPTSSPAGAPSLIRPLSSSVNNDAVPSLGRNMSLDHKTPVDVDSDLNYWSEKVVFVMVGLPCRGKSYLANKIVGYLQWMGIKSKLFNVGQHRRKALANDQTNSTQTADFFSAGNADAKKTRDELAFCVLGDLLTWMRDEGGMVAVFDATNTTSERRHQVWDRCNEVSQHLNVIFLESIVTNPDVVRSAMLEKIAHSPDYEGMPFDQAFADLEKRLKNYESVYESIDHDRLPYIKLMNLQSKVICNLVRGQYAHHIASFLMCCHVGKRPIWLLRSGAVEGKAESGYYQDAVKKSGRSPSPMLLSHELSLNEEGIQFANTVRKYVENSCPKPFTLENIVTYSSLHRRAIETSQHINFGGLSRKPRPVSMLNMLDSGIYHGMSTEEIKAQHPEEFEKFSQDPFNYRFPGGESYHDVCVRLAFFVKEVERHHSPLVIISHLSTLRVLYGYFVGCPAEDLPFLDIPQYCVVKLTPSNYGWVEERALVKGDTYEICTTKHGTNFYTKAKGKSEM